MGFDTRIAESGATTQGAENLASERLSSFASTLMTEYSKARARGNHSPGSGNQDIVFSDLTGGAEATSRMASAHLDGGPEAIQLRQNRAEWRSPAEGAQPSSLEKEGRKGFSIREGTSLIEKPLYAPKDGRLSQNADSASRLSFPGGELNFDTDVLYGQRHLAAAELGWSTAKAERAQRPHEPEDHVHSFYLDGSQSHDAPHYAARAELQATGRQSEVLRAGASLSPEEQAAMIMKDFMEAFQRALQESGSWANPQLWQNFWKYLWEALSRDLSGGGPSGGTGDSGTVGGGGDWGDAGDTGQGGGCGDTGGSGDWGDAGDSGQNDNSGDWGDTGSDAGDTGDAADGSGDVDENGIRRASDAQIQELTNRVQVESGVSDAFVREVTASFKNLPYGVAKALLDTNAKIWVQRDSNSFAPGAAGTFEPGVNRIRIFEAQSRGMGGAVFAAEAAHAFDLEVAGISSSTRFQEIWNNRLGNPPGGFHTPVEAQMAALINLMGYRDPRAEQTLSVLPGLRDLWIDVLKRYQ
ncbi:MAG TPA: hypothetical protein V6D17_04515 [Candidatus Obscuribacterales bacterium]